VLDGVSVDVSAGEVVALMGSSGSGKTTMLRTIAGLEPFERGSIDVDGVQLAAGRGAGSTLRALRTKVGMVFQFHCLWEHLTAIENVRPKGPSNGSARIRTPPSTARSWSAWASLARHQSWIVVVPGDGPGCPGRLAADSATVGQPTKTAESGPKSKVSRIPPR